MQLVAVGQPVAVVGHFDFDFLVILFQLFHFVKAGLFLTVADYLAALVQVIGLVNWIAVEQAFDLVNQIVADFQIAVVVVQELDLVNWTAADFQMIHTFLHLPIPLPKLLPHLHYNNYDHQRHIFVQS